MTEAKKDTEKGYVTRGAVFPRYVSLLQLGVPPDIALPLAYIRTLEVQLAEQDKESAA